MIKLTNDEKIIIDLAKSYHLISNVAVRVLNVSGKEIYREPTLSSGCKFCKEFNSFDENYIRPECEDNHSKNSKHSFIANNNHIYACPSNFIYWSSPITKDNKHIASIIAGSTVLDDKDSFIESYKAQIKNKKEKDALALLSNVNVITENQLMSLIKILKLTTLALFNNKNCKCNSSRCICGFMLENRINQIKSLSSNNLELKLIDHINNDKEEEAISTINEIYTNIIKSKSEYFLNIRSDALHFAIFLNYLIYEKNLDGELYFKTNLHYLKDVYNQKDITMLSSWLKNIINDFSINMFKLTTSKHSDSLNKAINYGKNNFSLDLTLENVAEEAGLSASYFSRIFKQEMKISFTEYLNNIRINESKRLLRKTKLNLADIATKCGFTDQSYFTKTFKKFVGLSPGKYRTNYQIAK